MKAFRPASFAWALCVLGFVASVLGLNSSLPPRVASHFGLFGAVHGWASRSSYTAFIIATGVGLSSFLVGICALVGFFPSSTLNVPNSDYWRSSAHHPEAAEHILAQGFWLGALTALWAGLLNFLIVRANQLSPARLDPREIVVLTMAYLAGVLGWGGRTVRFFKKIAH